MGFLTFLTSCTTKNFIGNEEGFRDILEQTPAGSLKIITIGTRKKTGDREWLTSAPWKFLLVFTATGSKDVGGCTIIANNLALLNEDDKTSEPVVSWEQMKSELYLRDPKDQHPSADFLFSARDFEHKDYKLSLTLSFEGECVQQLADHSINVTLTSFTEQSRASLWDNLMGI